MLPYPVGANRVWRQARGRVIPNIKAENWKRVAAIMVREAGFGFFEAGVQVHYKLHPRLNKNGSASAIRLDIDAPAKALLDAFNGVLWNDDKQVLRLVGEVSHPVEGGGLSVAVVLAA